jgi:phosphoserine phosphatase RsbU/P
MLPDILLELKDRALSATAEGITIADARLPDRPIIYANAGFERLTGYAISDVLGRNCRFLQGSGTGLDAINQIHTALREECECTVQLLNYRKDGTPFWNRLSITPVRDASGEVTHFIGVQSDVTEQKLAEEALEKARRQLETINLEMKRDLEAAALVQQSLLPDVLPEFPGVRLAWVFRPCDELAGDFLNVLTLDDRRIGLYVLDVSGHGAASALLSVTLSRLLSPIPGQSILYQPGGTTLARPAEVLQRLNAHFPFDVRTCQYFTMFYAILDIHTGELRYASAGHTEPILVPLDREATTLSASGVPVGLLPNSEYKDHCLQLQPGDRLFLYTDGFTEVHNNAQEEFGVGRLQAELAQLRHLPLSGCLASAVKTAELWRGSVHLADDASLLAVEIEPRMPVPTSVRP